MFSVKTLSLLALAGSTIATPAPRRNPGHYGGGNVVWTTVVHTVVATVTPGQQIPEYTPAPKPSTTPVGYPVHPVQPTTTVVEQPKPTTSKVVVIPSSSSSSQEIYVPTTTSKAPAVSSVAPAPSEPASGGGSGYMGTVNEWRAKLGLKDLKHSSKLETNAFNTAKGGNGEMVHKLNPGTMGQVLAPGEEDEFYHCFVGGWLCEKPNMPGMDGVCSTASEGWVYDSTGHADILISDNYSEIGCSWCDGIWDCDLA